MELRIPLDRINLMYSPCKHKFCFDNVVREQPLSDVQESGTLICPTCGDDLELAAEVTVNVTVPVAR